jgi:hypothetical protein
VLFDLRSGKRRRMVQVVYSLLAASFLIGFVFLGIGTGGLGSISDLFGGGGGGSTSSAYDSQIAHAKAELKKDPKDAQALQNLTRYEYLAGQSGVTQDTTTGQLTVSDDAKTSFSDATDAWARYVKVARKPDATLASQIAQAYVAINDPTGAAEAQRIYADARPSSNSIGTLAIYQYSAGDFKAGDASAKKAVAEAPKATRKQIETQLNGIANRAHKFYKAQAAAAKASASGSQSPGASQLQNPFGGLAPTSTTP